MERVKGQIVILIWIGMTPIGHVQYINILTWLRGFKDKLLNLALFSLYPSPFWELRDKRNLKNLQFLPESLGAMLKYWYIERGLLSPKNRRTNFVVTNFCLVCSVRIQIFKAGKFCRRLYIELIIFHLNSKHRTFWQDNGSRSNSRICAMFRAFRASSTQPLFFETSKTKPVLVRDPIQWPKNSRRVFQKTTASDGKLNSGQAGPNSFPEKWLTSLAQFCLLCQFCPSFTRDKFCRRCVWRFVRLRQNSSGRNKTSTLVKR